MKKSWKSKFGLYSAIGVTGGMMFGSTSAEADIIFTDMAAVATQGNPVSVDLDGDLQIDFVFDLAVVANNYGSNSNWAQLQAVGPNAGFAATDPSPFDGGPAYGPVNLSLGDSISNRSFQSGAGPLQLAYTSYNTGAAYGAFGGANFPGNTDGFVAISFDTGSGESVFGWIGVSISGDVTVGNFANAAIEINGWAYATDGTPIVAGQTSVPEPSSLALLALGAAGLATRRRNS